VQIVSVKSTRIRGRVIDITAWSRSKRYSSKCSAFSKCAISISSRLRATRFGEAGAAFAMRASARQASGDVPYNPAALVQLSGGSMRRLMLTPLLIGIIAAVVHGQQPGADVVLTNGKIITVDNKFTIAQAMAIRG